MNMEDIIIMLFVKVDDCLKDLKNHSQSKLSLSELVTLALLYAIKGVGQRPFYRWVTHNWSHLFPRLPERTRFFRRLYNRIPLASRFLADPTILGCIDSYGSEFVHPIRERRTPKRYGKKGVSNKRWIVGGKVCIEVNRFGQIIDFDIAPANTHDSAFLELPGRVAHQSVILGDGHFHDKEGIATNVKVCRRGRWNERMVIETIFSMMTRLWGAKKRDTRSEKGHLTFWAYAVAAFNLLVSWDGMKPDENGFVPISIKDFVL